MGGIVFIGTGILVVFVLRWIQASPTAPAPPGRLPPPPSPRRFRKRASPPTAQATPSPLATVVPSPAAPPVLLAPVVEVGLPRYGQHAIRGEFSSRAALRRAIIAQEVLGPPLALRPPRD